MSAIFEIARSTSTIIIAAIVAYIAYQQYIINKASLKEKLYDRRWRAYEDAHRFLDMTIRNQILEDSALKQFSDTCLRASFLFDRDVTLELAEINTELNRIVLDQAIHQLKGEIYRTDHAYKVDEERLEMLKLRKKNLQKLFYPYLSFEELK